MAERLRETGPLRWRPGIATSWPCILGRFLGGTHIIIIFISAVVYLFHRVTVRIK